MSSQAWRFPAVLGNVVPAGFEEVQSEASWLCVLHRLHNGSGNQETQGECDRQRDLSTSKASSQAAGNNSPGLPLPFVDSPAA